MATAGRFSAVDEEEVNHIVLNSVPKAKKDSKTFRVNIFNGKIIKHTGCPRKNVQRLI